MAFGSGSSFATDRWTRRKGSPSSLQALSVGSAKRLHQHSSSKPTAQVLGFSAATSISRSLLLFFVRTGGPGRLSTACRASSEPPAGAKASPGSSLRRGALRGALALRARQEHLRAAHGEGVFGAQPLFEALALLFGQRTYKDRCFHGRYRNPSTETYLEDALGKQASRALDLPHPFDG